MEKDNKPIKLKTADGKDYEVSVEGSLGLLALGYRGLQAWRQKRKETGYTLNQHLIILGPQKTDEQ